MSAQETLESSNSQLDEFSWLEPIHGEEALAWVNQQNARTMELLDKTSFAETEARILEALDSDDRIPGVTKHGDYLYNFWKDAEHQRGLWRRTTLESYRQASPDWDVILDLDALNEREGVTWVWSGAIFRHQDNARALLRLSPDGGDAVATREFDMETRTFVEDGFSLPVAKTIATGWLDDDTLLISTVTDEASKTASTYPRFVRILKRGQAVENGEIVLEVPVDHMGASGYVVTNKGFERTVLVDKVDFYNQKHWILRDGEKVALDIPDDMELGFHREWLLLNPKSDWSVNGETYVPGSLLATNLDRFLAGDREIQTIFVPDEHRALADITGTRSHVLLNILEDVSTRIDIASPGENGWEVRPLSGPPPLHTVGLSAFDEDESDDFWMTSTGYLTPSTLSLGHADGAEPEVFKSLPAQFDADGLMVSQHFATSKDGTRIPYFQISRQGLENDGTNKTLLYGYGGFEISLRPQYSATVGRGWLERGGVYLVANIRGGGEYGPTWHTGALHANRQRCYEDFSAVARDLIERGVTTAPYLACQGGSNGGLLVGNMLTQYPELFGAIACAVPLLDMWNYTRFCAGASWVAEYGDPRIPEQWEYVQTFSPFHLLKEGVTYPPVLFYTATSDDRVGPEAARRMAAKMQAMEIPDVWFYENQDGGHGGGADNRQLAQMQAANFEFLWNTLGES